MKRRRKWVRFVQRRRWYRYLRAAAIRAWAAIGPQRTIMGLFAAVASGVLNVDLGFAVTVLIAILFLIQWLVLTPSKMWDEAKEQEKDPDAKTVVHYHAPVTYVGQIVSPESVSSTDGINRAAPRSRRKSRRDPPDPPPSLGL